MTLDDLARRMNLTSLTAELPLGQIDVSLGYSSDLLSDVLAHAPAGGVLVTVQVHLNVIAVAVHAGLSAIIFAMDRRPEEPVRRKAVEEGVPLFVSSQSAFEIVGRLYELGVRGSTA